MRVKICGITRPEDARAVQRAGADALGLVLWKGSPRCVTPDQARLIVESLESSASGAPEPTGVFVNAGRDELLETMAAARLRRAQLHGDETPGYAASLPIAWYRVFAVAGQADPLALASQIAQYDAESFMLDAGSGSMPGGTGTTLDWRIAAKISMHLALNAAGGRRRLILAGGLTPDNVASAIRAVRPWQVDVSSGVESAPGIKDPGRIAQFIQAARGAA